MTLRLHVFQHVPHEGPGSLASVFAAQNAAVTVTRFFAEDPLPDPEAFDMLVVLGGPMNVHEHARYPWLAGETAFIAEAVRSGKAVLGVCLGAQLMAVALDGTVTRNAYREIGWWPVEAVPEARADARAACFPARFTTFHWHGDTFSLPPGAVPLFRSEACAHQGFAWGPRAVGLQFHPEITADAVDEWISVAAKAAEGDPHSGGGDLAPGPYVQTPEAMRRGTNLIADNNIWMETLCGLLTRGL